MCGIVGVTNYNHSCRYERFIESVKLLKRRGPDEYGFKFGEEYSFGHNRLVVIDKEGGHQPYSFMGYHLVYNGELYNTKEIRDELIALGYLFDGYSDTEVLLKAFHAWKEDALNRLEGIFAFGIFYDNKLFIARDRAGVKPLYYMVRDGDLFFASEIKSILHYYDYHDVDLDGLREVLGMGPSNSLGKTPYKDIFEVKPGEYIIFDGALKKKIYWDVSARVFSMSYKEAVKKTRELLEGAIKRQMVSDVPIATFLSGGLDSSIVTAVASEVKKDLETFTITYEGNEKSYVSNKFQVSSDSSFIGYMNEEYGLINHEVVINNSDLANYLDEALYNRDYPGMVDLDSSLYLFSKKIKETHTVLLSGECADEIFGGYPWFYRDDGSSSFFPWLRNLDFRETLLKEEFREKLNLKEYVKKEYEKALSNTPILTGESIDKIEERQMFYLNLKYFMANLLCRKDRQTMGASLEVRVPFADHSLIEFLYNVPFSYKYRDGVEKALLRDAFKDLLPKEIYKRKKSPYPKTHNKIYEDIIKEKLLKSLNDEKSILNKLFDKEKILSLLDSDDMDVPWYGQLLTKPQLLAYLYQIDLWFREYKINLIE